MFPYCLPHNIPASLQFVSFQYYTPLSYGHPEVYLHFGTIHSCCSGKIRGNSTCKIQKCLLRPCLKHKKNSVKVSDGAVYLST